MPFKGLETRTQSVHGVIRERDTIMAIKLFASRSRATKEGVAQFEQRLANNRMLVVRRFARGNIALQNGRVLTSDQLEKERESLRTQLLEATA